MNALIASLAKQVEQVRMEVGRLSEERAQAHERLARLESELSTALAQQRYGLAVGDVLEWKRRGDIVRGRITGFSGCRDTDDWPHIQLRSLKKDGSAGLRDLSILPEYWRKDWKPTWTKIEEQGVSALLRL